MTDLIHDLVLRTAGKKPDREAISYQEQRLPYGKIGAQIESFAVGMLRTGLARSDRVAVYLEKRPETVIAMFGAAAAGGVFVPINPVLKPEQVAHILKDCNVRILVTSAKRLELLHAVLAACVDLLVVVVVGAKSGGQLPQTPDVVTWEDTVAGAGGGRPHRVVDADMAAILYTSGSTGKPKGVVLSHRNIVAGATSVAQYLENCPGDRILSALPLSFDAGFSQLTTAFHAGASVTLMNYLVPRDVVDAIQRHWITGLTAVPPLW